MSMSVPCGPVGKPKAACVINDLSAYKAWRLQEPNAAKLLSKIMWEWRGSSIRVRGGAGVWTVWPLDCWAERTGLSRDQVKRALAKLVLDGFILRERRRFEGKDVRAFIQPTMQAATSALELDRRALNTAVMPAFSRVSTTLP